MPPVARAVLLVLAALAGAVAGVLGSFAHPDEVGALPVGLLLGLGLSVAVFVTSGLLLGRAGAAAAAAGWLGTVLLMSSRRPEGDLAEGDLGRQQIRVRHDEQAGLGAGGNQQS